MLGRTGKDPSVPLYHEAYLVMRDAILSGRYPVGSTLPSETELVQQFGISRLTLRKAMDRIEADSLVSRRRGLGTFVLSNDLPEIEPFAFDTLDAVVVLGTKTSVRVLDLDYRRVPHGIAAAFDGSSEIFQRCVRLRCGARGLPLMLLTTWIPEDIGQAFTRADFEQTALFELLEKAGHKIVRATQFVTAALADPNTAAALGEPVGSPLLQVERINYNADGRAVEYLQLVSSPLKVRLQMSLHATDESYVSWSYARTEQVSLK